MFDENLMFSKAQSVAQVAGSYISDFSIDGRVAGTPAIGGPLVNDFGRANDNMDIVLIVTTAFVGATATIQIQIIQADDGALSTNVEVLRETRALPVATYVKGVFNVGKVPSMSRRFLGLRYVIAVATLTAGVVTAGLRKGVPSNAPLLG